MEICGTRDHDEWNGEREGGKGVIYVEEWYASWSVGHSSYNKGCFVKENSSI